MPTLRVMYRSFDGFERALLAQAAAFAKLNPDVNFEFDHRDPETLHRIMVAENGVHSGDWDLMLTLTDWLPELMRDRGLLRLDPMLEVDPPEDWPHGWSDAMLKLQRDGHGVYALPYHDGPDVMHHRTDLFNDPDECEHFERRYSRPLQVPNTWGEFLEVAHFFNRPDDGLSGVILAGLPDGHNTVYDFMIALWSRGGTLLDGLEPAFDGPEGREALGYYVDLINRYRVTHPKTLEMDSVAAGLAYARGEAAMMLNWTGFMALAQTPPSRIIDNTRIGPIPRGDGALGQHTTLSVYWVLGICSGSRQPELAYRFLRHVASRAMDRISAESGAVAVRFSSWNDLDLQTRFGYYADLEQIHSNAMYLPALPDYPALNEVLNRMVDDAVNGRKTVAGALEQAANEWREILHLDTDKNP